MISTNPCNNTRQSIDLVFPADRRVSWPALKFPYLLLGAKSKSESPGGGCPRNCLSRIKDIADYECYRRIIDGCRDAAKALECELIEVEQLWAGTEFVASASPRCTGRRPWQDSGRYSPQVPERNAEKINRYACPAASYSAWNLVGCGPARPGTSGIGRSNDAFFISIAFATIGSMKIGFPL
jgi:hypothetical protein